MSCPCGHLPLLICETVHPCSPRLRLPAHPVLSLGKETSSQNFTHTCRRLTPRSTPSGPGLLQVWDWHVDCLLDFSPEQSGGSSELIPCKRYSCLGNPMDTGAWQATVHRVAKRQTRLRDCTTTDRLITSRAAPPLRGPPRPALVRGLVGAPQPRCAARSCPVLLLLSSPASHHQIPQSYFSFFIISNLTS